MTRIKIFKQSHIWIEYEELTLKKLSFIYSLLKPDNAPESKAPMYKKII